VEEVDHVYICRNFNGWCNNLNNPQWGKSIAPHNRFLPAQYDDGEPATTSQICTQQLGIIVTVRYKKKCLTQVELTCD
jgi:hypothetical protein